MTVLAWGTSAHGTKVDRYPIFEFTAAKVCNFGNRHATNEP